MYEKSQGFKCENSFYSIMDIAKWIEPVEYNNRLTLTPKSRQASPLLALKTSSSIFHTLDVNTKGTHTHFYMSLCTQSRDIK